MHNLDNIVRIYYSAVSACTILNKKVRYRKFPRDEFSRLYKVYGKHYSHLPTAAVYQPGGLPLAFQVFQQRVAAGDGVRVRVIVALDYNIFIA